MLGGDKMLKRTELAELLKVHVNTIDRYVKKGMPYIKVAQAVRFEEEEVVKRLREKTESIGEQNERQ